MTPNNVQNICKISYILRFAYPVIVCKGKRSSTVGFTPHSFYETAPWYLRTPASSFTQLYLRAIILDCGHSGSGTRGDLDGDTAVRKTPIDRRKRPLDSFIFSSADIKRFLAASRSPEANID